MSKSKVLNRIQSLTTAVAILARYIDIGNGSIVIVYHDVLIQLVELALDKSVLSKQALLDLDRSDMG